jgi:ribosomal protein S18 acetylase RimI-like enzyme
MFKQIHLSLDVTIRLCEQKDLLDLEWFGMFADMRGVINLAYDRYVKGENIMLVAEVNHFPVGQVWIDLTKLKTDSTGVLWALRVLPPLQNLGIGSALIRSAESILTSRGYKLAELGIAKDNNGAKRLYERLGYRVIGDNIEEWDYITLKDETVHVVEYEWILRKSLANPPIA